MTLYKGTQKVCPIITVSGSSGTGMLYKGSQKICPVVTVSSGGGGTSYVVTDVYDEGSSEQMYYSDVEQALLNGTYTPSAVNIDKQIGGGTVTWVDSNNNEMTMDEIIIAETHWNDWTCEDGWFEYDDEDGLYYCPYVATLYDSGYEIGYILFTVLIAEE